MKQINASKLQKGGAVGGLQPVKVESGEMIFSPGSYGSEIPALNSAIPRFQSGGMINSANIKADPQTNIQNFINKRFQNTSQARDVSQSNTQPTIIPVPMPMSGGQSGDTGGESGSPIPTLTSSPSNHIVSALMMSSYSLMRNIG